MVVHTRTIVDPRFGAKLTGKVGKTTVGMMLADDEAPGKGLADPFDVMTGKSARSGMGRVRYDYKPESYVGALFTDREFLDGYSRVLAYDFQHRIGEKYRFYTMGALSNCLRNGGTRCTSTPKTAETNPKGWMFDMNFRRESRNLGYFIAHHEEHPEFATDLGFVRRVDQKATMGNVSYRWWPESWIVNWGPQLNYDRNYDFNGILQNAGPGMQVNFNFARNINLMTSFMHDLERYREVDFYKTRFNINGGVNASRKISFRAGINQGDEIRFIENPYLGFTRNLEFSTTVRPISRLQAQINLDWDRFIDSRTGTDTLVYDVKIFRATTTYQFTDRLLLRNIMERNTFDKTIDANLLLTYRVNSGTAFYLGYDDHYQQGNAINPVIFSPGTEYERTNRAIFTKLQYLFRNGGSS
jgi:hypothetical protein